MMKLDKKRFDSAVFHRFMASGANSKWSHFTREQIDVIGDIVLEIVSVLVCDSCVHEGQDGTRSCDDCGAWTCPDSPDKYCRYTKSRDCCDYCRKPEERK